MIDLLCHKFLTLFYLIHLIFWVSLTQKKSQNDKFEVKILPEQILNISIYFYLFHFKKIKFMIAHVNEMLIGSKRKILKIQCYSTLFFRSSVFLSFNHDTNPVLVPFDFMYFLSIGTRFCEMHRIDVMERDESCNQNKQDSKISRI